MSARLIEARSAPLGWLHPLDAGRSRVVSVPDPGDDAEGVDGADPDGAEGDEAGEAGLGAEGSDTPLEARARLIRVTSGAQ